MTTKNDIQKEALELFKDKKRQLSRTKLSNFVRFTFEGYDMQWFHKSICDYLDKLLRGDIKKLMIFVPPQHGKSELSSRRFPAYALGKNPNEKIAVCSYGADLASTFNRSIQMIIDDPTYSELFPNTQLNSKRVSTETKNGVLRNSTMFEIVGHKGYLRTVGVGGGLTGITVDLGIIDDPFKDRMDANSITIRNRVWAWYKDVFETRLHNKSRQLMLFTRWHEDDIAGRILDPNNPYYDEKEASEWTVIAIPAIKEAIKPLDCAIDLKEDKRKLGQALWESKHSRDKYEKMKRINPTGYASLAQQRPAPLEGDMIKSDWFPILTPNELPFKMDSVTWCAWIDGAWQEKESNRLKKQNDPDHTAISFTYFDKKNRVLYIRGVYSVQKKIDDSIKFLGETAKINGIDSKSTVYVEMKSSGWAIKPALKKQGFNVARIPNKIVSLSKSNMVEFSQPSFISERVVLIRENGANWINAFLSECTSFPNGAHDDKVDVLTSPTLYYLVKESWSKAKTRYRN
jgi:predicted phage terminase large subunit-like protein